MKSLQLLVAGAVGLAAACSHSPLQQADAAAGTGGTTKPGTAERDGAAGRDAAAGIGAGPAGTGGPAGQGGDTGTGGMVVMIPREAGVAEVPVEAPGVDGGGGADAEPEVPPPVPCPAAIGDGGAQTPPACLVQALPSQRCSVETMAGDAAALCAGAATCPVTAAVRITCESGNERLSLAPATGGASLILDAFDPELDFVTHLLTITTSGASRVEVFPHLGEGHLSLDGAGVRNVFFQSVTGAWWLRETPGGWRREDLEPQPLRFQNYEVGPSAERITDGTHAHAVLGGAEVWLAVRDAAGWKYSQIPGLDGGMAGLDLDADGHVWLAATSFHPGDTEHVFTDVVLPDGTKETLSMGNNLGEAYPPIVLAGGITGHDARPAVVYGLDDGVHIATPKTPTGWSVRLVPMAFGPVEVANGCPAYGQKLLNCGVPTCELRFAGTWPSLGFVRTASGASFVAWLEGEATQALNLNRDPTCGIGAQGCTCTTGAPVANPKGSSKLAVARVPADPAAPLVVQRFPFPGGGQGRVMAMAVRGDTLLVAANVNDDGDPGVDLRYLELDATKLP